MMNLNWLEFQVLYQWTPCTIQLQHGMMNLNYLIDHILYYIFKTILDKFKILIILQQEYI